MSTKGEILAQKISQEKSKDIYRWIPHTDSEIEANIMREYKLLNTDPLTNKKLRGQYQTTFDSFTST
ncbi:MAG: hypothetical protein QXD55_00730 [Candidatus Aenigmatarchaeota archaeon]